MRRNSILLLIADEGRRGRSLLAIKMPTKARTVVRRMEKRACFVSRIWATTREGETKRRANILKNGMKYVKIYIYQYI